MEHARAGLQKIVLGVLRGAPPQEAAVLAWPVVAGASVADNTRALDCVDGVLRVEVHDRVWRAQLLDLVPHYLALLKPVAKIERIEFVLAAGGQEAASHKPKSNR